MSQDDPSVALANFDGRVRLFPMPDVVLLPHVAQPLHVFEPRYRELLAAALDSDQLITMAVLRPGWEDAEEPKPIHPQVCIGRVVSHTPLPDGRSNILLLGCSRAELLRELPEGEKFRVGQAELRPDRYSAEGDVGRAGLQQRLLQTFRGLLPQQTGPIHQQLDKLLAANGTLGMLTDVIASMTELPAQVKLDLLATPDVDRRAKLLLATLEGGGGVKFPPEFSDN